MGFEEKGGSEMVGKKLWDVKPSIPLLSPEVLGCERTNSFHRELRQLSVNSRYHLDKRLRLRAVC